MLKLNKMHLDNAALLARARLLPQNGYLIKTKNNLLALKVTDEYIHQLQSLLKEGGVNKPDYFGAGGIGAHISVVYPEEATLIFKQVLGEKHFFKVQALYKARIIRKDYYLLTVIAPTLLALRKNYGLHSQLLFKRYRIDFHITLGVGVPES